MPTELPTRTSAGGELPERLFLPASRARWVFTLVISGLIVALDIYLVATQGGAALVFLIVVFGIAATLAGVQLIPGSAGLWLDRDGFTYRIFWYDRRRRWAEITPVVSSQVGLLQLVGYHKQGEPTTKAREVLPDTYGISANELAEVMNHWRDTALRN